MKKKEGRVKIHEEITWVHVKYLIDKKDMFRGVLPL